MKAIVEQPIQRNEQPGINPLSKEALLLEIPVGISLVVWLMKEIVVFLMKKKTAEYAAEIERQKVEQQEKAERIEYLEKQNQILFQEILSFRRKLEISEPPNSSMYESSGFPKKKSSQSRSPSGADARS